MNRRATWILDYMLPDSRINDARAFLEYLVSNGWRVPVSSFDGISAILSEDEARRMTPETWDRLLNNWQEEMAG